MCVVSLLTRINELRSVVEGVVRCVVRRVYPSICFTLYEEKITIDPVGREEGFVLEPMNQTQAFDHRL